MRSILSPGFGFIEILVVLVVILFFSLKGLQIITGKSKAKGFTFQETIFSDFESSGAVSVESLTPQSVLGKNDKGTLEYRLEGPPPNSTLARLSSGSRTALSSRIAFFRVTPFDISGHFMKDEPSVDELKSLGKIQFDIGIHDEKEDADFFINDKSQGIDLDGNPANGVSHITSRSFEVTLPTK